MFMTINDWLWNEGKRACQIGPLMYVSLSATITAIIHILVKNHFTFSNFSNAQLLLFRRRPVATITTAWDMGDIRSHGMSSTLTAATTMGIVKIVASAKAEQMKPEDLITSSCPMDEFKRWHTLSTRTTVIRYHFKNYAAHVTRSTRARVFLPSGNITVYYF